MAEATEVLSKVKTVGWSTRTCDRDTGVHPGPLPADRGRSSNACSQQAVLMFLWIDTPCSLNRILKNVSKSPGLATRRGSSGCKTGRPDRVSSPQAVER